MNLPGKHTANEVTHCRFLSCSGSFGRLARDKLGNGGRRLYRRNVAVHCATVLSFRGLTCNIGSRNFIVQKNLRLVPVELVHGSRLADVRAEDFRLVGAGRHLVCIKGLVPRSYNWKPLLYPAELRGRGHFLAYPHGVWEYCLGLRSSFAHSIDDLPRKTDPCAPKAGVGSSKLAASAILTS